MLQTRRKIVVAQDLRARPTLHCGFSTVLQQMIVKLHIFTKHIVPWQLPGPWDRLLPRKVWS